MKLLLRPWLATVFVFIVGHSSAQQVYTADNGITASGTSTTRKVSLGGNLTGHTTIGFNNFNVYYTGTGNVGIRTNAPLAPLHVYKNVSGNFNPVLVLEDGLADGYVMFQMRGTGRQYHLGVGNASETFFGLANKFFVWDQTAAVARMVFDPNGNVGIGTVSPANRLSIASATAGTSGLQFTQLTSASTAVTGNGKVLSVDASGNVILVNDATSGGGGGSGWSLSGNAGIPAGSFLGTTDNNNLVFKTNNTAHMQLTGDGNLMLGGMITNYKLHVAGASRFTASMQIGSFAITNTALGNFTDVHQGIQVDDNNISTVRFVTSPTPLIADNFSFENVFGTVRDITNGASIIRIKQGWGSSASLAQAATLRIDNEINNLTGAPYILRGIYYNPQLTNTTGVTHIAYENTNGVNILNSGSGNTLIGTSTDNGNKLQVNGNIWSANLEATNLVTTSNLKITTGAGLGKILFSDPVGNALWGPVESMAWAVGGNANTFSAFGTKDNNSIPVITNNQLRMWIDNDGNVGIGNTFDPTERLDVLGNVKATGLIIPTNAAAGKVLTSDANGNATWQDATGGGGSSGWALGGNNVASATKLGNTSAQDLLITTDNQTRILVNANGTVGIGTTQINENYKLFVEGSIRARKIRVDPAAWPDYVFDQQYKLPSLAEVAQFIQQHHHLPDMPPAAEVEKNGLDLGDNQALLLKKIEELTLYIIDLNNKVEKLAKENMQLKKKPAANK
jgi:hypothetical protein